MFSPVLGRLRREAPSSLNGWIELCILDEFLDLDADVFVISEANEQVHSELEDPGCTFQSVSNGIHFYIDLEFDTPYAYE